MVAGTHSVVALTYDSESGGGRGLAAGIHGAACVAGTVVLQGLPDLEAAGTIDFGDDVLGGVVDADLVLVPGHRRGGQAQDVTLKRMRHTLGELNGLEVLGELRGDNLLVCLCAI